VRGIRKAPGAFARALSFWMALAAGVALAEGGLRPWSGPQPESIALKDLDGTLVDLGARRGRVQLVNFWATWCEPCREEMPSLERLRGKLRGRPFDVVTVNFGESAASAARFVQKLHVKLPVLLDPEKRIAEAWRVKGLPMTFLIDAKGKIRWYTFGERDWSEGESFALIERLVKEAVDGRR
jgi:thiol-disulfide isomerase/thioredoxin